MIKAELRYLVSTIAFLIRAPPFEAPPPWQISPKFLTCFGIYDMSRTKTQYLRKIMKMVSSQIVSLCSLHMFLLSSKCRHTIASQTSLMTCFVINEAVLDPRICVQFRIRPIVFEICGIEIISLHQRTNQGVTFELTIHFKYVQNEPSPSSKVEACYKTMYMFGHNCCQIGQKNLKI